MYMYERLRTHPDSPIKQFLDKEPEPEWCWLGDNPTDEELKAKKKLDDWRLRYDVVQDKQNEWEKTARKQIFKEELLSERKNKKLLIDFIDDYFVPGWTYYKYMWNPFSTGDLLKVRDIIKDYAQERDFEIGDTKIVIFILGAFDNTTQLTQDINFDFIDSLRDLEKQNLDVTNVWAGLTKLAHFVWANQKYNQIWHHVIPNAIEIRTQVKTEKEDYANGWRYDQEYTVIGTVKREGFHPTDAQWQRSEFHKEAYLDQKLKGKI